MTSRLPKWMDWIWPHSLARQIALVIALALLAAQTLNVFLLMGEHQIEQLSRNRDIVETTCTRAAKAIYLTPIAQRVDEARRLSASWLRLTFSQDGLRSLPSLRDDAPLAQRIDGALRRERLAPYRIEAGSRRSSGRPRQDIRDERPRDANPFFDGPPPWPFREAPPPPGDEPRWLADMNPRPVGSLETVVGIQLEPRSAWLICRVLSPPQDPFISLRLLSATLALYVFVLGAAIMVTRRLGRPLSELAVAASQMGRGQKVSPIEPMGPVEVATAAQAFNEMNARITGLLAEKDAMLGAIGHDLRTPLTSLRIRAENLPQSGEVDRMIATIDHLSKMLDGILQLAQLGNEAEAPVVTDVGLLIATVVEEFEDLGADVTFKEPGRVLHNLRPHLSMRLLRNLIENALKYGQRARVHLRAGPDRLLIQIDDDGPGLDPSVLERIMQPFERLETSRNRQTGGAGLGLAIARGIAELHDSQITFANRAEGGLRVTVSMPVP